MFSRARWRLTLWFAGSLALILAVIGVSVYLIARAILFGQVDGDLKDRARRELSVLPARLVEQVRRGQRPINIQLGTGSMAGGYFYALVTPDTSLLASTIPIEPQELPGVETLQKTAGGEAIFVDTRSAEGDTLRVYVHPIQVPRGETFLFEVGRSIEPELQALRRLRFVLAVGGGGGFLLALAGGFFLAGRALGPLQQSVERERSFVADASHELRTPLSLIRASAELVKRHPERTVGSNMTPVNDIIQETDRLSALVGQMLTLAQADSGQAKLSESQFDLTELVSGAGRRAQLLAEAKQMTIEVQTNGAIQVKGDQDRLHQLVMILLDNAIKYSEPRTAVRLDLMPLPGRARLLVSDRGHGIPAGALPHIFERFYRVDKARSREMGGSGLGLSIAKWIVDSHNGTIKVESSPGTGTTVTVDLPRS